MTSPTEGPHADGFRTVVSQIRDELRSHGELLREVRDNALHLNDAMTSFWGSINVLSAQLDVLKVQRAEMEQRVGSLELAMVDRRPLAAAGAPAACAAPGVVFVTEAEDRFRRANNLLLFNVPDSADETPDALIATIGHLLSALEVPVEVAVVRRLGYYRGRCRPILLELESLVYAKLIMCNRFKLRMVPRWQSVVIGVDRTIVQLNDPRPQGNRQDGTAGPDAGQTR